LLDEIHGADDIFINLEGSKLFISIWIGMRGIYASFRVGRLRDNRALPMKLLAS
jgi:hypothetical protein